MLILSCLLAGVANAAKLMDCEIPDLMLALSTRKIQAGNDNIIQKLTLQQVHWNYLLYALPLR